MQARSWELSAFGLENLACKSIDVPDPGPGEVRVAVRAFSLNYRDLMVIRGHYNPRLALPAVPVSDAAGLVEAVGDGVVGVAAGDQVMTHFVSGWQDGPYRAEYLETTLGTPATGVAAEHVVLPATAVVPTPQGLGFAAASTLPIAALTAWSALVTDGELPAGGTVLTLGTGGVSVFAVQLGVALGARVLVTSSSEDKLARARELGAEAGVNYASTPAWEKAVLALTDGVGVDVVVENGGAGTLGKSLRATRAGGTIAMLGALTGLRAEIDLAALVMKRIRVHGVMVNHRAAFGALLHFLAEHPIAPVIDARFPFDALPAALEHLAGGAHFGKVVVEV